MKIKVAKERFEKVRQTKSIKVYLLAVMFFSRPGQLEMLRYRISSALLNALEEGESFEIPEHSQLTTQKMREVAGNPLGTSAPVLIETLRVLNLRSLLDEVLVTQVQIDSNRRKK